MSYLLDTNVLSEPRRKRPEQKVINWLANVDDADAFISALTVGEFKKGVERLPSGSKKAELQIWMDKLRRQFSGKVLPLTEESFLVWGKMMGEFEVRGIVRSPYDSLLEATAIENDLVLVTRNVRNFKDTQLTILNPWED